MNIKEITNYENTSIIYMNFSMDQDGIVWGLPEGDKTQHGLSINRLIDYKNFLNNAIEQYKKIDTFYNGSDFEATKKVKKYSLYLKRLESVISKLYEQKEEEIKSFNMQVVFDSWPHDESIDVYNIEINNTFLSYLPDENVFLYDFGGHKEKEITIQEVALMIA